MKLVGTVIHYNLSASAFPIFLLRVNDLSVNYTELLRSLMIPGVAHLYVGRRRRKKKKTSGGGGRVS